MIDRNVRVPRQVLGDVRSQVAACFTGQRGYLKLMVPKLTPEYARREYGVAIDVEARKVLPEESAQLRASMTRS